MSTGGPRAKSKPVHEWILKQTSNTNVRQKFYFCVLLYVPSPKTFSFHLLYIPYLYLYICSRNTHTHTDTDTEIYKGQKHGQKVGEKHVLTFSNNSPSCPVVINHLYIPKVDVAEKYAVRPNNLLAVVKGQRYDIFEKCRVFKRLDRRVEVILI